MAVISHPQRKLPLLPKDFLPHSTFAKSGVFDIHNRENSHSAELNSLEPVSTPATQSNNK